jgi:hypothetical protein
MLHLDANLDNPKSHRAHAVDRTELPSHKLPPNPPKKSKHRFGDHCFCTFNNHLSSRQESLSPGHGGRTSDKGTCRNGQMGAPGSEFPHHRSEHRDSGEHHYMHRRRDQLTSTARGGGVDTRSARAGSAGSNHLIVS